VEIFEDGQGREDPSALRDVGDSETGQIVGRDARQLLTLEKHPPAAGGQEPRDALQQGSLSGSIGSQNGHHLTRADMNADVMEHPQLSMGRTKILDSQQFTHF
jgi:hypothetical protein